jgi:CubicO group peptidase (beta-lactamase class C family)
MKKRYIISLAILAALVIVACASNPNYSKDDTEEKRLQKFESWLESLDQKKKISGTFLFARKGEVIYTNAFGNVHPEKSTKITTHSSFNLASVSKQFTGMGIMLLESQGKLKIDDKVQHYLPQFIYPHITIRQLLNHTSGFADADYMVLAEKYWDKSKTFTNEDMLDLFTQHKPKLNFTPGDKFQYSNTGYVTLSAIIEKVSGVSFADYLDENIFSKLDMNHTQVINLLSEEDILETRVYGQHGGTLNDLVYLDGVTGDGAVYSSVHDLMRWHKALLNNELLSKEEQEEAFKAAVLNDGSKSYYGFGWGLDKNNPSIISHSGGWVGFRTHIICDLGKDEVLVILTNDTKGVGLGDLVSSFGKVFNP